MKISFFGAAGCVTGSNFLIETSHSRFLVDCGMFQGSKTLRENNYKDFAYDPASIDFVLLTHAHIDHTGLVPKLVKHGFKGPIYSTEPTLELLKYLFPDSAYIQTVEVAQKNRRNERKGLPPISPIYDEHDAEKAISLFKPIERYEAFTPAKGCKVVFHNAGHILGSSFIEIILEENGESRKIIFSGDLGQEDRPIVKDHDFFEETDYLVIESTYGNRNRTEYSREERLDRLYKVLLAGVERGGKILIPSFALERTQDLIHDILTLKGQNKLTDLKVVIDSPLATNITKVFRKYPEHLDEDATKIRDKMGSLFSHPDFTFTESVDESKALNKRKGIAVLSASGMCDAGRIKHHLKNGIWNPENTLVFVGYQAHGTLGSIIQQGAKKIRIHGEEIEVGAVIEQIHGYSGHADQAGLLSWLKAVKKVSQRVFVVHGETDAAAEFAKLLHEKRGFNAVTPAIGESFDLLAAEIIKEIPRSENIKKVSADAHNLYAELMLDLAEFMRSPGSEADKAERLQKLKNIIG